MLLTLLRKKYLHWFSGKRTFIDGGVYIRFRGGVGSRVIISSVFMWFCIFLRTSMFLLISGVSKDSEGQKPVRFIVSRQYQTKKKKKKKKKRTGSSHVYINPIATCILVHPGLTRTLKQLAHIWEETGCSSDVKIARIVLRYWSHY